MGRGGNLWRHRDFLKFWTGDTVTQFTGQITLLALPTVAVLTLEVTAFQLGLLEALGFIAFPVLGLPVGVWIDRMKRKPVMIAANLIQVAALGSVPVAFLLGVLGLYQLYLVALVMGTTTLFFDVAYQSYLPSLVDRSDVIEGNQKLQTSASAAQVAGPSVASGLMALMGAALSIAADAFGTLASVVALVSVRKTEPAPELQPGQKRDFVRELKEGVRVISGNALLWTQAGCTGTANFGSNVSGVAVLLYAYRVLGISKDFIGVAFSMGAAGFLIGALVSSRVTGALGFGRAVAVSTVLNFGLLLALLASGTSSLFILGAAFFVAYIGVPIYNINQVSLRQIITPDRLQGRMNATMRTIVWGTIPAGAVVGGILSGGIGIIPTFVVGVLISGGAVLWVALGPILRLKKLPDAPLEQKPESAPGPAGSGAPL